MANNIELFGNAFECAHVPAMIVNGENIITHTNHSMAAQFGDIVGHHRSYLFANDAGFDFDRPDPFADMFANIIGDENHAEAVIADVTYDVVLQHVTCAKGNPFTVMAFEDITEKKNLENEVSASLEALQRETSIAKDIQRSILPINNEYWNIVRLNAIYLPAGDLGGDVYDLIRLSEDEILFYIADVSGHGIQGSLLTIYLRENIRAATDEARESLSTIMRKLLNSFKSLEIDSSMYIGLLLCKYNRTTKELSVINSGHNCYPLIIRNGGRVEEIPVRGMPLSRVSDGSLYNSESVIAYSGDRVILFTDGIQDSLGSEGIRRVVSDNSHMPSGELIQKLVKDAGATVPGKAKDDRTVIAVDVV